MKKETLGQDLNKKYDSQEIEFIEENQFSKPIECEKLIAKIDIQSLSVNDLAFYYKQKGLIALDNANYFQAFQNIEKSLQIAEENDITKLIDSAYINLSAVFYYTQQYKKAIHNAFKASRSSNKNIQSYAYQNLASNYELTGDYEKAMVYNKKAIEISNELNQPDLNIAGTINSGNIMLQLGKNKEALEYFELAVDVVEKGKLYINQSDAYAYLAGYYDQTKDFNNAIKYAKIALKYAEEYKIERNFPKIYYIIINSYYQQDKIKQAKKYLNDFQQLNIIDADEKSQTDIYDIQIEIEHKTSGAESALKIAKNKIAFLERKEKRANSQLELFRMFKEDENEKIEESRRKLAQSNTELLTMAKILAHDIKTPVRTLGSFSELLKQQLKDVNNPIANEYLDFITEASVNLYSKLESALSLVLMELKKPLQAVNLNLIIEKTKSKFSELEIIISKKLPEIKSNKQMINSLLYCLFENAVLYNTKQNPQMKINHEIQNESIKITFSDNGDGIASEELTKVFDIFYSSNPNLKKGIGLSICKKICELHGGSISLFSTLNKGTDIFVELPINGK